jgi:hypothetical protein
MLSVARHLRSRPRWRRGRGACIELKYSRDLAAFLALTDLDAQLGLGQHCLMPAAFQYTNVKEYVA